MKFTKRLIATGLAAVSVLGVASCGGGSSSELSIFLYQEDVVYNADMPVFKNANEYAGIELEGVLQKYDSNFDSIYTLRGKNANIVVNDQDTIEATALKEGIFLDLTALINEHAPNLKAYFDANPTQKAWATASDGKIYGIPFYTDGKTAKAFFVRQDWVKLLKDNGKLPSGIDSDNLDNMTVEQYEALLMAFKNNEKLMLQGYPATTIYPYFDRDSDFAISELAGLWGATGDLYIADGSVAHGAVQPEFREAMKNIVRWYKNKLIEPDILVASTTDKRVTYFSSNQGGSTHDWIGTTYSFNDDVYAANLAPDFDLTCILPPVRQDGSRYEATVRKQIGKVTAINVNTPAEDQIKAIKWIDYFFSEKGHKELNYGIEGEHFNMENGVVKYTNKIVNSNATALASLYAIGAQLQSAGVQTFEYEKAWLSDEANAAMTAYEPYLNKTYNELIYPNVKYTNEEYQKVNEAKNMVAQVYLEQVNSWLTGKIDINNDTEWSKYLAKMEQAGVQTIVSLTQAAYNRKAK